MRSIILIALVLSFAACVAKPAPIAPKPVVAPAAVVAAAPEPPAPQVNLVCEAFKGVNDKATCAPTFTDVGELHVYMATVTLGGQQLACRTDLSMLGVLCTDPIVIKQQPPPPTEDKAKKPESKKK